jgi:hypothetical protein
MQFATLTATVALWVGACAVQETLAQGTLAAPPTDEHAWLQQLVGEWTAVAEANMGPGVAPMKVDCTESMRSIGGLWVVGEGSAIFSGVTVTSMLTIGYDPTKKTFVGSWVDSTQTHMWTYLGKLDETRTTLILEAEGPDFVDPTKTAHYRDIIELLGKDKRVLTSWVLDANGNWTSLMRAEYARKRKPDDSTNTAPISNPVANQSTSSGARFMERARNALVAGDNETAKAALQIVMSDTTSGPEARMDAEVTLASIEAEEGQYAQALERLARLNRTSPSVDSLCLEMRVASLAEQVDRSLQLAGEFGTALAKLAINDRRSAHQWLVVALLSRALDAEILEKGTEAAVRGAASTSANVTSSFLTAADYLEDLERARALTTTACGFLRNAQWIETANTLYQARVSADSVKSEYPRQVGVISPVLATACGSAYALAGRMQDAQRLVADGVRLGTLPAFTNEARLVSSMLVPLVGSRLDAATPSSGGDAAVGTGAEAAKASLFYTTLTKDYSWLGWGR